METSGGLARPMPPGGRSRRRLTASALALLLLLLLGAAVVDTSRLFFVDEGAVVAQAKSVSAGSWAIANPAPEIDPEGRWFPIEYSLLDAEGNGAPYAKHAAYPWLLRWADAVGGLPAMVLLSIVGTIGAALAAAHLARCTAPRWELAAFWATGLGSPLLFDSYLVVAHTLGAAAAGAATVLVLRALMAAELRGRLVVGALACFVVAGMLRSEAVLYGIAVALAVVGFGEGSRARRAVVGAAALLGVAFAYLADARLVNVVTDRGGVAPFSIAGSGGWLAARAESFVTTVLAPAFGGEESTGAVIALAVATACVGLTALTTKGAAEGEDVRAPRAIAIISVLAYLVAWVLAPDGLVPGLLVAFPVLLWLAVWSRVIWPTSPQVRVALVAIVLYAGSVVVTQYASGGGPQWGGRYYALAIPLAVALLATVADLADRTVDRTTLSIVGVSMALILALLGARSMLAMRSGHEANAVVLAAIVAELDDQAAGSRPLVVTTDFVPGRLAWDHLDDFRWLFVPEEQLAEALDRVATSSEHEVLLLTPGRLSADQLGDERMETREPVDVAGGWVVQRLCTDCGR